MNRSDRIAVAEETISISKAGVYRDSFGEPIDIKEAARLSISNTSIENVSSHAIGYETRGEVRQNQNHLRPNIEVADKTTLDAAYFYVLQANTAPTILNFASAKHPGGGFKNGSLSQEEDIAYRSTHYAALQAKPEYYKESHRTLRDGLYFDKMLYTEGLVVIRDANYKLSKPWYCNCITSPAPNRGAALQNGVADEEIDRTMKRRIVCILELAALKGAKTLILGAFGCGVFRNDPHKVAKSFYEALIEEGHEEQFEHICFAIPGENSKNHQEFKRVFLDLPEPPSI
jgi:uncharacterized protein (TIGR02452 family)